MGGNKLNLTPGEAEKRNSRVRLVAESTLSRQKIAEIMLKYPMKKSRLAKPPPRGL